MALAPENPFYTTAGRDRGISLHEWLAFLVRGKNPANPPDPRIADKVESIRAFIRDTGFKIIGGEEACYCPEHNYACTPDLWGFIVPWSWVIDMKSGAFQAYHSAQTATQKIALRANGFNAQKRGALYLKKNKKYRLEEHTDRKDLDRWLYTVSQYHKKEAV